MTRPTVKALRKTERWLVFARAFFDGLDRFGATVLALSFIGGLLAPLTNAMTPIAAWIGIFLGLGSILIFGYLKEISDVTLKNVRELIRKNLVIERYAADKARQDQGAERT